MLRNIVEVPVAPAHRLPDSFTGIGYGFVSDEFKQGVNKNPTKVDTIREMINLIGWKKILITWNVFWKSTKIEDASLFSISRSYLNRNYHRHHRQKVSFLFYFTMCQVLLYFLLFYYVPIFSLFYKLSYLIIITIFDTSIYNCGKWSSWSLFTLLGWGVGFIVRCVWLQCTWFLWPKYTVNWNKLEFKPILFILLMRTILNKK